RTSLCNRLLRTLRRVGSTSKPPGTSGSTRAAELTPPRKKNKLGGKWVWFTRDRRPDASTRLEAGFLDQPSGIGPLFLQVAGKLFGGVENGLQPDFGYPLLPEYRLIADASDVRMQFLNNGFGRASRGNEAEVNGSQIRKTQLIQGRHVRK